jgi:hypothetical protein
VRRVAWELTPAIHVLLEPTGQALEISIVELGDRAECISRRRAQRSLRVEQRAEEACEAGPVILGEIDDSIAHTQERGRVLCRRV